MSFYINKLTFAISHDAFTEVLANLNLNVYSFPMKQHLRCNVLWTIYPFFRRNRFVSFVPLPPATAVQLLTNQEPDFTYVYTGRHKKN